MLLVVPVAVLVLLVAVELSEVVACAAAIAPVAASDVASAPPTIAARVLPERRLLRMRARTSWSCSSMVGPLFVVEWFRSRRSGLVLVRCRPARRAVRTGAADRSAGAG